MQSLVGTGKGSVRKRLSVGGARALTGQPRYDSSLPVQTNSSESATTRHTDRLEQNQTKEAGLLHPILDPILGFFASPIFSLILIHIC